MGKKRNLTALEEGVESAEGIDDDFQSKCVSSCDMDLELNISLEEELDLEVQRSQAELEAAARKHEIVVEMQGLEATSNRIRTFLERNHQALLHEANGADDEAMLLGMLIEANDCVACQLDRLESKLAGSRTLSPVVVESHSSNVVESQGSNVVVSQQKRHRPDAVPSTTGSLVGPEKVDSLGRSIIVSTPTSATPEGEEEKDKYRQMARAA